jgi:hypothetical protein
MKNWMRNLGVFGLLAISAGSVAADDQWITWLTSYREALQQARQTHKPIFLEFRCEA